MPASFILYFSTEYHNSKQNIIIIFWIYYFGIQKSKIACSVCGDRGSSKSDKLVTTSVFPEANYKVFLGREEKSSGNLGKFSCCHRSCGKS
jgi:hypothetical protein